MNAELIANIIQGALMLVGFASVVAVFTPTPKDDAALRVVKKILDFAAMNWGHARNAEAAPPAPKPEKPER